MSSDTGFIRLARPAQPKASKRSLQIPRAAAVASLNSLRGSNSDRSCVNARREAMRWPLGGPESPVRTAFYEGRQGCSALHNQLAQQQTRLLPLTLDGTRRLTVHRADLCDSQTSEVAQLHQIFQLGGEARERVERIINCQ